MNEWFNGNESDQSLFLFRSLRHWSDTGVNAPTVIHQWQKQNFHQRAFRQSHRSIASVTCHLDLSTPNLHRQRQGRGVSEPHAFSITPPPSARQWTSTSRPSALPRWAGGGGQPPLPWRRRRRQKKNASPPPPPPARSVWASWSGPSPCPVATRSACRALTPRWSKRRSPAHCVGPGSPSGCGRPGDPDRWWMRSSGGDCRGSFQRRCRPGWRDVKRTSPRRVSPGEGRQMVGRGGTGS